MSEDPNDESRTAPSTEDSGGVGRSQDVPATGHPATDDPATREMTGANSGESPDSATTDSATTDSATAGDEPAGGEPSTEPAEKAATDMWEPIATAEQPRAYSQMSEAPTSPTPTDPRNAASAKPATATFTSTGTQTLPPQEPPTQPPADGVVTSAPGRGGKGKFIALGAVGVVLLVVIALVGSELFFRSRITNCLQDQLGEITGQPVSVSLSKKPVLVQVISKNLPYVQIDTDDSGGSSAIRLHVRADGVTQSGDAVKIDSVKGTGFVSFQRIVDLSKDGQFGLGGQGSGQTGGTTGGTGGENFLANTQITSLVGNPADGTIKVDAAAQLGFIPIPVSLTLKPVLDQGKVTFTAVEASAFIFGIPADYAQQFVDGFGDTLFGELTDDITVQDLKVTEQGVDFSVTGSNLDLSQMQTAGGQQTSSCSLF
ncbi:LmeA family phospholipid-binding protein [Gordonia sp. NB41Y]|uniref:LmeA family phospholipid-binding protein n=1 Tax=Gordonia sp. NB41Y TaxID=875808 RepID=UPI0006B21194|nr:LmeA family phospholipid-binding protein [Gordonia sp. NB41Y]EMP11345.2 hypothetical protein ISGA_4012 [Gordonia sp. NB41Y]WLP89342.1 LmeA family phospholipid-binding protein [Gordonia sp. NB41Y]